MSEMVTERAAGGLFTRSTTDATEAVLNSEGVVRLRRNASLKNGKARPQPYRERGAGNCAAIRQKKSPHVFVLRSTVLAGRRRRGAADSRKGSGKKCGADSRFVDNPEFMREGSAVADFLNPPYTILGASDTKHLAPLRELYKNTPGTLYEYDHSGGGNGEKYFSNCYHALKVWLRPTKWEPSASISRDAHAVTKIFTSDTKLNISPAYLFPGFAFGGHACRRICGPSPIRRRNST